jgi:hypothetical protein
MGRQDAFEKVPVLQPGHITGGGRAFRQGERGLGDRERTARVSVCGWLGGFRAGGWGVFPGGLGGPGASPQCTGRFRSVGQEDFVTGNERNDV